MNNKVIAITGAAEGIGFNITDKYLKNGAELVILLDINEAKGKEAVALLNSTYGTGKAVFIKCDVTKDLETVSNNILNSYNIDVLVNSAGIWDETNLRKTMEVNAIALIEWSMKFWRYMRKDNGGNGGTIVNLASMTGFVVDPFMIYYKCSKFTVIAFTKSLGHEYHYNQTGVRIVALCPGFTRTSLTQKFHKLSWGERVEDFDRLINHLPWQSTDVVGNAAVEVFHKAESGTAWVINGGQLAEAPDFVKLSMKELENPELCDFFIEKKKCLSTVCIYFIL